MSKARLIITAVVVEGRSQAEVARSYGVSKGWVSKLLARYREVGEEAFEPRSRRPKSNPNATPPEAVDQIVAWRRRLSQAGLDVAGGDVGDAGDRGEAVEGAVGSVVVVEVQPRG